LRVREPWVVSPHTGPISGIEIIHHAEPEIQLEPARGVWAGEKATDAPVSISHAIGDVSVDGMRHVTDIGLRVSYFAPMSGGIAVRIRNLDPKGPVHLLRVVRPGCEYTVSYEFAPASPAYRRDVEIAAFAHALTVRGTRLMAHGCGVIAGDGRGVVCLGTSGAGKSTASRMLDGWRDARLLNDDRLVIERRETGFQLWSTPWPGTAGVARTGDAKLSTIALIGRGAQREKRVLARREALPRVLATLALPIWDQSLMWDALGFVDALLEQVPVVELRYPLDATTPEWLAETLLGERW
jgi:hypothetical protein